MVFRLIYQREGILGAFRGLTAMLWRYVLKSETGPKVGKHFHIRYFSTISEMQFLTGYSCLSTNT